SNDIGMIRAAHTGVAMANADPEVKEAADRVTVHDNNHDGIAEIIETMILN
ncbi:MAG: HAD hydrolase family protein, partial [Lachnospiraceae bacterium]|nr:HAD hydrolase family protein [Lachnospiraceae bacterium]